jgi:hypothetical protein
MRSPIIATVVLLLTTTAFAQTTQPSVRGMVGENLSYLKPQSGRILINAGAQGELPVQTPAGLRWQVFIGPKGSRAYDGTYVVKADAAIDFGITGGSPAKIIAPGVVAVAVTRDDQSPQLNLLFPGRTELPAGIMVLRPSSPPTPQNPLGTTYTEQQAREQVFTDEYLAMMRRFNPGVIRAMDWQRTNGSTVVKWADRCTPQDAIWGVKGKGGPIEPVIDLCNALNADLWVCVPHGADDDYVRQLLTLIRSRLKPGLRVYVEYSNEVWNTDPGFTQTPWMKQQAALVGMTYRRFYAKRASEIDAIGREVFNDQPERFVVILAGQTGDSSVLRESLAFGFKPGAVATGGYFDAPATATSPDAVFATFPATARAVYAGTQIAKFNDLAAQGPYRKLIYEWTGVVPSALAAATRDDPRWGGVMLAAGAGIFGNGFEAACVFVPLSDSESKYAATDDVGRWTWKAESLANLSAAHPLPLVGDDPVVRLEMKVNDLSAALAAKQAEAAQAAAERDDAKGRIENARRALGN